MANKIKLSGEGQTVVWTALLTPILLFITIIFMGGGHGTYFLGKLFYPVSMIIASINDKVTDLAFGIAVLQIPFYGFVIYISKKSKRKMVFSIIIIAHFTLFIIANSISSMFT